jgi:CubicO group peptidase (beta-lactamase class C family)
MRVDGLDAFLTGQGFSGVVLLRRGEDIVFEGAYGLASPRWGVANAMDTRFDTASITKLFTSIAVFQLVGRGELDLDTSIHAYAGLSGTTISPEVTLRHLLTHTSGIADDADEEAGEDYADLWVDKASYSVMTTRDFLPQFAHKEPLARPGEQCRYCNVGYVLAGLAVEHASGQSYRDYVVDQIFTKAGMVSCGFFDRRDAEPNVAEGFDRDEDGRLVQNIFKYPPIGSPDGGAHVTASDLIRFIEATRAGELLPPDLTRLFFTPQVHHDEEVEYGFGLAFRGSDWWKRGSNAGVSGIVKHYGEHVADAVVLSNTKGGAWPVEHELDRLALG